MIQTNSNYVLLINKLDAFTRKYYINQLLRGSLYFVGLVLVLFLALNLLEHNFFFSSTVRKGLLLSFVGVSLASLYLWVLSPILKYFSLGKKISHEEAANIIGTHFTNVKDKLLNILQLKKLSNSQSEIALIEASIQQKSDGIKLVPFNSAIDLSSNRKYFKYALPPLLLLIFILFASPSLIKDSTSRLINVNQEFEKKAPYSFLFEETNLEVVQFEDYELSVTTEGSVDPNEVFIEVNDQSYRMSKNDQGSFSYRFHKVQKEIDFKVFTSLVAASNVLKVIKKPMILDFEVFLDFPSYTGRSDELLNNIGDFIVPSGTKARWDFRTINAEDIEMMFPESDPMVSAERYGEDQFNYSKRLYKDEQYKIYTSSDALPKADSVSYNIRIVPDQYPVISVKTFKDSLNPNYYYFAGSASDDYGLKSLSFNYQIQNESGELGEINSTMLPDPKSSNITYNHTFDITDINLSPGDQLIYYFEIYDNDAINGSKSSKTDLIRFYKPTFEEYEDKEQENNEDIKDNLKKSLEEAKDLQKEIQEMKDKLLQKENVEWQNKKELEKFLEKQKELEKALEEAKKKFEENQKNQDEFSPPSEEIQKKQEKIEEMFEELMSEEMKSLMEQIEELMQELDKDKALEMMEQFNFNDQELEKELDRLLELFKQLELERDLTKQVEKLEKLSEKEEKLSEETKSEEKTTEEIQEKQEEINKELEDIQKEMEELEKKNEELDFPKEMGDPKEDIEDIQEEIEKSEQELQEKKQQKAAESQKKAAQKMKDAAQKMEQQMQSAQMEQMQMDMKTARQLLENLVTISYDQEEVQSDIARTNSNTPRYVSLLQEQKKLHDDFKLVADSLHELSKRVEAIQTFITEKITDVNENMVRSLTELEERNKNKAADNQLRSMKNLNDLALMLSEAMDQMQQQMASMMQGAQMCDDPNQKGEGQKPMDKISEGQNKLNEMMKEMKEGMKEGKDGEKMSEEFAKMAAEQAKLRKALKELQRQEQEQGKGSKGMQEIADDMDKVETDLVNKRLDNETLKRQQDILTRLLEAEKAEREREYDEKRKSEEGKELKKRLPPSLEEYLQQRKAEIDEYKTVSPDVKPYYKKLINEYYKKAGNK